MGGRGEEEGGHKKTLKKSVKTFFEKNFKFLGIVLESHMRDPRTILKCETGEQF